MDKLKAFCKEYEDTIMALAAIAGLALGSFTVGCYLKDKQWSKWVIQNLMYQSKT